MILCPDGHWQHRIVALTLLDRLVVAAFRSGSRRIRILGTPPSRLPRSDAWRIPYEFNSTLPRGEGPFLLIEATWLLQASDLTAVRERQGRLVSPNGEPIPAGIVAEDGGSGAKAEFTMSALIQSLNDRPAVVARGVACPVRDAHSAQQAGRALWASITSSSDGMVDRWFNRPLGRRLLSKWLVFTPITPNQVSLASILIGVIGAWLLGTGLSSSVIWGAVLFQLSAMVDCVDGDIARSVFKESKLGKWLDLVGDQVVHVGVFVGIAWGLYRSGSPAPVLPLGLACVIGALASFGVVLRGILHPAPGGPDSGLQKLIDGATSRDFSVLVLLLACLGRLEWFLWVAAIGSQVFWITALTLQQRAARIRGS